MEVFPSLGVADPDFHHRPDTHHRIASTAAAMIAHNVTPIATMMAKQTAGEYGSMTGASRFLSASALSTDNVSGALRVAAGAGNGPLPLTYQPLFRGDDL
jgi:hypothetical protein